MTEMIGMKSAEKLVAMGTDIYNKINESDA